MRRPLFLIALLSAAALAACDPAPPPNTNEVDQTDVNIVVDDCTDAEGRVCP